MFWESVCFWDVNRFSFLLLKCRNELFVFVSGEIHEMFFMCFEMRTHIFIKDSVSIFLLITTFCQLVDVHVLTFPIKSDYFLY